MSTRQPRVPNQLGRAAVQMFAASERMNQILIEHLDPTAWKAKPPGKARTIAAIFTHMHNARCKWVRLTAPHLKVPRQLERAHCTPRQARAGLTESAARCSEMLAEALGSSVLSSSPATVSSPPTPPRPNWACSNGHRIRPSIPPPPNLPARIWRLLRQKIFRADSTSRSSRAWPTTSITSGAPMAEDCAALHRGSSSAHAEDNLSDYPDFGWHERCHDSDSGSA